MDNFSDDDEECRFFDAHESVASVSDSRSDCQNSHDCTSGVDNCSCGNFQYDFWVRSPSSVSERRRNFFGFMGLSLDGALQEDLTCDCDSDIDVFREDTDRIMESSGAVLDTVNFQDEFSSSQLSVSSWSIDPRDSSKESDSGLSCLGRKCILECGYQCTVDDLLEDGKVTNFGSAGVDQLLKSEEFESSSDFSSPLGQIRLHKEFEGNNKSVRIMEQVKRRWLSRLRSVTCVVNSQREDDNIRTNGLNTIQGTRVRRVKVRHCRKQLKEFSAVFIGQDIQAHEGPILSMKFSLDGQYLATAGVDRIVRVWRVVEDERSSETDIPEIDPSCIYFAVNHLSELGPLVAEEKTNRMKSLKKTADSACVILPPKVFRIIETPLHLFPGHTGEILDLSWSKSNCLLSSSVDKTVRLWQVGCDQCLKVFPHNNYVTCVQFNPVNDDYFISGSIDGKVRIWSVTDCQVIDWTDVKDIVSAVSYSPDGQGGIIGSIMGTCRFFSLSGNHFQVEAHICLSNKKKSHGKRITGFQFFPQDPSKVMVTCADSQVRILSGFNVIKKYKGIRNGGDFTSASLTSNGKYIISASEDSNVYVWNCASLEQLPPSRPKSIRSFESFSADAYIAIPWCGLNVSNASNQQHVQDNSSSSFRFSSSNYFSLARDFFLESIPKGGATWPEEKLPSSHRLLSSAMCKSQYKFFRTSFHNLSSSDTWGLVIVTASCDGRVRSFHNYGLPAPI